MSSSTEPPPRRTSWCGCGATPPSSRIGSGRAGRLPLARLHGGGRRRDWVRRYDALADWLLPTTGLLVVDLDSTGVDRDASAKDAVTAFGRLGLGSAGARERVPSDNRPWRSPHGNARRPGPLRLPPDRSDRRAARRPGVADRAFADRRAYQEKVAGSMADRQRIIRSVIPEGSTTAIQHWMQFGGYDAVPRPERALGRSASIARPHSWRQRSAVQQVSASAGSCRWTWDPTTSPGSRGVDVILLLSVHHHWMHAHGPATTGAMVRGLVERTDGVLVVEVAARRSRDGDHPPDFVDNDEASVTAYHEAFLRRARATCARTSSCSARRPAWGSGSPSAGPYALRPTGR